MIMGNKIVLTILGVSLLFLKCANLMGGSTETSSRVSSMLYNPGGSPAANAKVCFYRHDNDPRPGQGPGATDSTFTDTNGNYAVALDTGTYNVLANSDSGLAFQGSIRASGGSHVNPPACTLKTPGTLHGVVQLQPGDDSRTVFILFLGTHFYTTPDDAAGNFSTEPMAGGKYRVRILTTLPDYQVMDTSFNIKAGKDSVLADTIRLKYTGILTPKNLKVSFDTLHQTVDLSWDMPDTSLLSGYNVYRSIKGQNFSLVTQTPLPKTQTTYYDTGLTVGTVYEYRVVSRTTAGIESKMVDYDADTALVVSSSLVTTIFSWSSVNTIHDTASINDTVKVIVSYSNPTRKIDSIEWYVDTAQLPCRTKIDSSLSGRDTLTYYCPAQAGLRQLIVKAIDAANTVWKDTFKLWVILDAPKIVFLSGDTIIDYGGTVRCSVYVRQEFGAISIEIDSAKSGTYKSIGSLGLSGGKAHTFSTGSACGWDSVKVRVTDDDGNIVIRGFKLDIRPRSLSITSIDSTTTIITVNYSQSQESDFTQYRIYRNAINSVDTLSELWATISASGTVSYTTPTPSYAWTPRYYRVYQKDNEGLWSRGSNVVYGNIINTLPSKPEILYPINNGDTIWSDETIRWTSSSDPNQNVTYSVMINPDNTGYTIDSTGIADTIFRLKKHNNSGSTIAIKIVTSDGVGGNTESDARAGVTLKPVISGSMRLVTAGSFTDNNGNMATISNNFWIDTVEVTSGLWDSIMKNQVSTSNKPAGSVNWYEAVIFCNERSKEEGLDTVYSYTNLCKNCAVLDGGVQTRDTVEGTVCHWERNGYRLPTEDEWELAAKAKRNLEYSTIDGTWDCTKANTIECSTGVDTVASFPSNPCGIYDMCGNVHEWVWDWDGDTNRINQRIDYKGELIGNQKIHRGGSFAQWISTARTNSRARWFPRLRGLESDWFGFRCVRNQ
jgi:formylglycine-generating enzyme